MSGTPTAKTLFAKACATGDLATVEAGLAAGAGLGPVNPKGLTPLHLAALTSGSPQVVRRLVDAGADVNARLTGKVTRFSAYAGRQRVGRRELTDPDTPLHAAVKAMGNPLWRDGTTVAEIVAVLLDAGADPDALGGSGLPPLTWIAYQRAPRTPEIMRLLLTAGADREAANSGTSPLFAAVSYRNGPAVDLLLEEGADPCRAVLTPPYGVAGSTPLHMAVVMCDPDIFRTVLAAARDVDVKDTQGATALHFASRFNGPGTVRRLLARGADPHARLEEGIEYRGVRAHLPLEIARAFGLDDVAAVIEEYLR